MMLTRMDGSKWNLKSRLINSNFFFQCTMRPACCLGKLMMMRKEKREKKSIKTKQKMCVNEWVGWSISHIISEEWVEKRKTRKKFNFSKWHIITVFWVPSMHRISCIYNNNKNKVQKNKNKRDRRYAMMMRRHIFNIFLFCIFQEWVEKPQRTTNHVVHALRSFYDLSLLITKIIASKKYWLGEFIQAITVILWMWRCLWFHFSSNRFNFMRTKTKHLTITTQAT
jgi:hypothetical protein